jgi:general secretion pathway protein K
MVMVSIAVLTALAVDLAYDTQVRLRIAANARDELRATALAQGGVNLARMVLGFQAQMDQLACAATGGGTSSSTSTSGANSSTKGTSTASSSTSGTSTASSACIRPQLWTLIPVSSALTDSLFADRGEGGAARGPAGGAAPRGSAGAKGAAPRDPAGAKSAAGAAPGDAPEGTKVAAGSYGDFEGGFDVKIEDEGQKVNMQLDALQTSGVLGPQVEALLRLCCEAKWDPLFDRDDAEGQRYSRTDLVVALRDWVDDDASSSALAVSFPSGNCSMVVPASPFEQGFADENSAYDRGAERYKAKNARLDSLDELYLVAGVSDAFMAAFSDQLTVYLPREAGINVNSDDPAQQLRIATLMADSTSLATLADPAFSKQLQKALSDARMGGFLTLTPLQFAQVLQGLGVKVRSDYTTANPKSPFTDHAVTFRVRAQGVAGDVSKTIDAVISFDPNLTAANGSTGQSSTQSSTNTSTQSSAVAQALSLLSAATKVPTGRLIRWREE